MMIERFQYYIDENLVKKGGPDKAEASSLMAKAAARLAYVETQKMDENTAPFIFEDIYEALREAGQALMTLKGYKPYSHEALISFLREFFNFPAEDIFVFDRYRILRNKAVYSAAKVSATICGDALVFLRTFLPKMKKEFDRLI